MLPHGRIGVAEACSGLSMLTTFFALATAVALVIRRPWLDKVVVLLSAAPIAVVANVARIATTALAQEWFGAETAHYLFHDLAGWLMMPLALVLLWAELRLVSFLLASLRPTDPSWRPCPPRSRLPPSIKAPGPVATEDESRQGPTPSPRPPRPA